MEKSPKNERNFVKVQTYAYLRVSKLDQDLEKNKMDILKLANEEQVGHVQFVEEKISGKIRPVKLLVTRVSFMRRAFERQHRTGSGCHGGATTGGLQNCGGEPSRLPSSSNLLHSNSCHYAFAYWKRADHWLSQLDYSTHADLISV